MFYFDTSGDKRRNTVYWEAARWDSPTQMSIMCKDVFLLTARLVLDFRTGVSECVVVCCSLTKAS